MLQVSLEEAKVRLLDLVEVVLKGETVVIFKDRREAVQIVPLARRQFGSAEGLIVTADDFDAPLPDFDASTEPQPNRATGYRSEPCLNGSRPAIPSSGSF